MMEFHSQMTPDMKDMIELKAATNFSKNTYTDRAKAFDEFCIESFPEEEVITESITLCWIKDALDDHARNTVHSRIAFIRTQASYQRAIGKTPYFPPSNMLNGKSMFIPYIFTDDELRICFIRLTISGGYYEHYLFISFWLLFMTGMRIGEAPALQWDDIDFETGLLSITKTLYYKSMTEYKFVEPKTQASKRTIVINEDTIRELKEWKEVQQKVLKDCNFVISYSGIPTSKHLLPRASKSWQGLPVSTA